MASMEIGSKLALDLADELARSTLAAAPRQHSRVPLELDPAIDIECDGGGEKRIRATPKKVREEAEYGAARGGERAGLVPHPFLIAYRHQIGNEVPAARGVLLDRHRRQAPHYRKPLRQEAPRLDRSYAIPRKTEPALRARDGQ